VLVELKPTKREHEDILISALMRRAWAASSNVLSAGLKRLIPAFESLYASMTPEQQKRADKVFGQHQHRSHS
jgi:hypothetical protein